MEDELVFIGANPSAMLWDGEVPTAFASVWRVDWSLEGPGGAVVICRDGELRILCDTPLLGRWLHDTFVTHFAELTHFKQPARPSVERVPVKIDLDLVSGLAASAGDVSVRLTGILDRRPPAAQRLRLSGVDWTVSLVWAPCRSARIEAAGAVVPGLPRLSDGPPPTSSAGLAVAEAWIRTP